MYKNIVIKVGTNVLTRADGKLDYTTISSLVDQIADLKKKGIQVVLVSSGAVGAARSLLPQLDNLNKIVRRQLLSSIGQIRLMNVYQTFFSNYDMFCAQVLATKEDFRDRQHYLNMKNCMLALQRPDIIPIVNENDVISIDELMFTDNDELAAWIASMIGADALFILTNVNGIYDGHPKDPSSRIIPLIDAGDDTIYEQISPNKSTFGRGGMATKYRTAQKVAKLGISTFICNGKHNQILGGLMAGEDLEHTKIPAKEDVSNIKRWIAFNEQENKAQIIVNEGAERALRDPNTVNSLLPVGVVEIKGDFEKNNLVEIYNPQLKLIARGLTQYNSQLAKQYLGQAGQKALVHYDHLLIY